MALDTIKLRSPYLSEELAAAVEQHLVTSFKRDNATGEILSEFTSGSLEGSHDSRISVKVCREEWQSTRRLASAENQKAAVHTKLVACEPYLEIEGSVHKAMLGHNVYGGPCDPLAASRWFIAHIAARLALELPDADSWVYRRIDWAEMYELPYAAAEDYIRALNMASFPRRKVARYSDETVFFPGHTTALKLYHKGPEFAKHDARRLRLAGEAKQDNGFSADLQKRANELLRVEVEVKARKLDDDFKHPPMVRELTNAYLETAHDREVVRLLREGKAEMETVRKHQDVEQRLYSIYKKRLAGVLFGTWFKFSTLGEKAARKRMSDPTYYRHRDLLLQAGVSWLGSDVGKLDVATPFPADFRPVRSDRRWVTGEHPRVIELLAPYRDRKEVA